MTTTRALANAVADAFGNQGQRRDLEQENENAQEEEAARRLSPAISVTDLESGIRSLLLDEQVSRSGHIAVSDDDDDEVSHCVLSILNSLLSHANLT